MSVSITAISSPGSCSHYNITIDVHGTSKTVHVHLDDLENWLEKAPDAFSPPELTLRQRGCVALALLWAAEKRKGQNATLPQIVNQTIA